MLPLIIKLYDNMSYLVHTVELTDLPQIIIWGSAAFLKTGKRTYRQTTMHVLTDTYPVARSK